jgi:hypothetical protein
MTQLSIREAPGVTTQRMVRDHQPSLITERWVGPFNPDDRP